MTSPTDLLEIEIPGALISVIDASLDGACLPVEDSADVDRLRSLSNATIEVDRHARTHLVMTAMPPQVDPNGYLVSIADEVRDGKATGIADLRDDGSMADDDESEADVRLVVTLKREVDADAVLGDLMIALWNAQREAFGTASVIRARLRGHTAGQGADEAATVALSRADWDFLVMALDRHRVTGAERVLRREALDVIQTGLHGPYLDEEVVATGRSRFGIDWTISTSGRAEEPMMNVTTSRDGRSSGTSGVELRPIRPESSMRAMTSLDSGRPVFVSVSVADTVDAVVATTSAGRDQVIVLSGPDPRLGRRFGADDLLEDESLASLRAEANGIIVEGPK